MKVFATVLLATVALAHADVSLLNTNGYDYRAQPFLTQTVDGPPLPQQPTQAPFVPSPQYIPQRVESPPHPSLSDTSFPVPAPVPSPRRHRARVKIPKKAVVTKNFFIHTAPEETEDDLQDELSQVSSARKHYNVLFVKTPTQTNKAAAVNLANAIKEEKTVVYVLSKKTTASDLQEAIAEAPQYLNKPEVFFIKYRTPEEAAHAQRQIQSQYDSLGGSSIISDEGVVPTTSVVGSLDAAEEEEEIDQHQQLQQVEQQPQQQPPQQLPQQPPQQPTQQPQPQYLPPPQQLPPQHQPPPQQLPAQQLPPQQQPLQQHQPPPQQHQPQPQQLPPQHLPQQQQQHQQQTFDEQLVNSINNIAGGGSSGNNNQYLPPNRYRRSFMY